MKHHRTGTLRTATMAGLALLGSLGTARAVCTLDPLLPEAQFGAGAGTLAGPVGNPEECSTLPPVFHFAESSAGFNYVNARGNATHRRIWYRNRWTYGGGNIPAWSVNGHFQYTDVTFDGPGSTVTVQLNMVYGSETLEDGPRDVTRHWRVEFFLPPDMNPIASTTSTFVAHSTTPPTAVQSDPLVDLPVGVPLVMRVGWQWACISGGQPSIVVEGWAELPFGTPVFELPAGYTAYSDQMGLDVNFLVTRAGNVPGLQIGKGAGSDLDLTWQPSCSEDDDDYAIYEGTLGDFTSHLQVQCSTAGATSAVVVPASGDRYFLVTPLEAGVEGSYGRDGADQERPAAANACAPAGVEWCR